MNVDPLSEQWLDEKGIYAIVDQHNGKTYVGSAARSFRSRLKNHQQELKQGIHCNPGLQATFNKHGDTVLCFQILEVAQDLSILYEREQFWLNRFKQAGQVYNCGADVMKPTLGLHPSDETREKLRQAKIGNKNALGHKLSQAVIEMFRQRKASSETRAKMSAATRGRKLSEEHRAKIGLGLKGNQNNLGRHLSDQAKAKLSAAFKGHATSPETIEKIRIANTGKTHTEATRAKLSANHKGIPVSEEAKKKISDKLKGRTFSEEHKKHLSEARKGKSMAKHSDETKAKMRIAQIRAWAIRKQKENQ